MLDNVAAERHLEGPHEKASLRAHHQSSLRDVYRVLVTLRLNLVGIRGFNPYCLAHRMSKKVQDRTLIIFLNQFYSILLLLSDIM